jgi:alpha-amylase
MFKRKAIEELFDHYFWSELDRKIFQRIAERCYLPTNKIILKKIDEFKHTSKQFKVSFSISGIFLEQCKKFNPEVIESFKQLASTGCVEFLEQTYYHSLVSLYEDKSEFKEQIRMHRELIVETFEYKPTFFENTELIYNNKIAEIVKELGYKGIFTEGANRILSGRSPNYVYRAKAIDLKVLLRNYQLTDDIGFRFSSKKWEEYPLTADKYASWLAATPGQCINIFPDYETFGEHHWPETGIREFLYYLPDAIAKWENLKFATPTEIVEKYNAVEEIDVPEFNTISWADLNRDTSCWLGNAMQWACYQYEKELEPKVKESGDLTLLKIWRYLGESDHLYYIYTSGGGPGEVHSYFSPYEDAYNAFITFFSILHDFDARARDVIKAADEPFIFSTDLNKFLDIKAWSLKGFFEAIKKIPVESLKYHMQRGDFERWIRSSLRDEKLADQIKELKDVEDLRSKFLNLIDERLKEKYGAERTS